VLLEARVQLENCQVLYMFSIYAYRTYRRRRSSPEEIAGGGCSPEQGRREGASCARAGRPTWWGKLLYSGMSGIRREKGAERPDWEEGKMWEKGPERAEWKEEERVGAGETDVREAGEKT
jgi:hypothetical protein